MALTFGTVGSRLHIATKVDFHPNLEKNKRSRPARFASRAFLQVRLLPSPASSPPEGVRFEVWATFGFPQPGGLGGGRGDSDSPSLVDWVEEEGNSRKSFIYLSLGESGIARFEAAPPLEYLLEASHPAENPIPHVTHLLKPSEELQQE